MNLPTHSLISGRQHARGFTLVELLVVIAIIAILAGLLLPVISSVKTKGKVAKAKLDMGQIEAAMSAYDAEIGRPAVSPAALGNGNPDYTFGTGTGMSFMNTLVTNGTPYEVNNNEVMAVVMALTQFRNNTNTVNTGNILNPQKNRFLTAKEVDNTSSAGVGRDGVYRDPWGNPYIISIDANFDGVVQDAFYRLQAVSQSIADTPQGLNGHEYVGTDGMGNDNQYGVRAKVIVWSAGPDGEIDHPGAATGAGITGNAKLGKNEDNVLSWAD